MEIVWTSIPTANEPRHNSAYFTLKENSSRVNVRPRFRRSLGTYLISFASRAQRPNIAPLDQSIIRVYTLLPSQASSFFPHLFSPYQASLSSFEHPYFPYRPIFELGLSSKPPASSDAQPLCFTAPSYLSTVDDLAPMDNHRFLPCSERVSLFWPHG